MCIVASSMFRALYFPHEGKIVTIDQLDYYILSNKSTAMGSNVTFVGDNPHSCWVI